MYTVVSRLPLDAILSLWLTQLNLLFSNIFYQYFPGDLDGVNSQNGESLAYCSV